MDIGHKKTTKNEQIDFKGAMEIAHAFCNSRSSSTLFSKGERTTEFFTEDSKLYITPREQRLIDRGVKLDRRIKKWDAISSRVVGNYQTYRPVRTDALFKAFEYRYALLREDIQDASRSFVGQFSMVRLWNMSIVGALILGMVSMTFIYRYLGQGAAAGIAVDTLKAPSQNERTMSQSDAQKVLGAAAEKTDRGNVDFSKQPQLTDAESNAKQKSDFEKKVRELVKGYPIEEMVPYIMEKDEDVAAFMISIAKKESDWGKHVPVLKGQDCNNLWGYRAQRQLMGTGGHTCFNSKKDAVDTVAKRIKTLVQDYKLDTPQKMIIWKCGSSCAGDSGEKKWISDVNMYMDKLKN